MKIHTERLRRLEQLREMRRLPSQEGLDEQKTLFRAFLKAPGASLASLIREISAAYRRREYTNERKNAALALLVSCHERHLLDQLSLCWKIDEERKLKRAHWFALALLEGCETLFLGCATIEPWFFQLVRLIQELVSYAQYGFLCDPEAGSTVRQNKQYAMTLIHRCERLLEILKSVQGEAAPVGGIKSAITCLGLTRRIVKREVETSAARRARIKNLALVLDTKRLAYQQGAVPVLNPELFKTGKNARTVLPS